MNLSYWEIKSWFTNIDFTIVGSGIVGLNCALRLKERFPKSNILVLEKGPLPQGASTKNAGFACFGSLSELMEDLQHHTEEDVYGLVQKRVKGIKQLRQLLGDEAMDYQALGGYELFTDKELLEHCQSKLDDINTLISPIFKAQVFSFTENTFGFKHIEDQCGFNPYEAQIDTGLMMRSLISKAQSEGIMILNNTELLSYSEDQGGVKLKTNISEFKTKALSIATNGFASQLLNENIQPARAQVLITKPIKDLKVKGTFHLENGYYYFRNIDDRLLLGGGRNLDFKTEETTQFGLTESVQHKLEDLLRQTILPHKDVEIEHRWSGIMGVGTQKKPIVKAISDHVYCGVRLGGMGVAIGSSVGMELADLMIQ
ncbi:MAG: FAD-dependent oxidoreductase [Bacteroidota bacterium]